MKEKEYLDRMLDLLVDMSNHCKYKDTPIEGKSKCVDCGLKWNFNIRNHGCLLVDLMANDDFIDDLRSACISSGVDYESRLSKLTDILITECD